MMATFFRLTLMIGSEQKRSAVTTREPKRNAKRKKNEITSALRLRLFFPALRRWPLLLE